MLPLETTQKSLQQLKKRPESVANEILELAKSRSILSGALSVVQEVLAGASTSFLTELLLAVYAELGYSLAQNMKYCGEFQRQLGQKVRRLEEKNELLEEEMNFNDADKSADGLPMAMAAKRSALRRLDTSLGFILLLQNYLDVFGLKVERLGKVLNILLPKANKLSPKTLGYITRSISCRDNMPIRRLETMGMPTVISEAFLERPRADLVREWLTLRFPMLKTSDHDLQNPFAFYETFKERAKDLLDYFVTLDREFGWFKDELVTVKAEEEARRGQLKFMESINGKISNKGSQVFHFRDPRKQDSQAVSSAV